MNFFNLERLDRCVARLCLRAGDNLPFSIPGLPCPASLQAPGKLEAGENMRFSIDDNGVQR